MHMSKQLICVRVTATCQAYGPRWWGKRNQSVHLLFLKDYKWPSLGTKEKGKEQTVNKNKGRDNKVSDKNTYRKEDKRRSVVAPFSPSLYPLNWPHQDPFFIYYYPGFGMVK